MVIFWSYNSFSSFSNNSWFDALSFGSMGQANTFCSKVPNINLDDLESFNFFFQCDNNYFIQDVFNVGLIDYQTTSV